jgi:hypothetical protein
MDMFKSKSMMLLIAALLASVAVMGCSGQGAQQTAETATDSLLSANPFEDASGDITPQEEFQQQQPATPPPAPKPAAKPAPKPAPRPAPAPAPTRDPGVTLPAGTAIALSVNTQISSETVQPGDTWQGVTTAPVVIGNNAPIPAGALVNGVVAGAKGAEKGDRAFLLLSVRSISVNGKEMMLRAATDSIVAGSTRARNLGAIAGGAAAGALIGKAVGGSGKGALIGGLIGGAAATAGVAGSKGYQVVLKEGTELTFHTTSETVVHP